ncbi:MAG: hypothetical protein ACRETC_11440 [Gammaproteobacteria bacterium]
MRNYLAVRESSNCSARTHCSKNNTHVQTGTLAGLHAAFTVNTDRIVT